MDLTSEQLANLSPQEKRQLLRQLLQEGKTSQPKTYPLSFAQQRLWFLEQFEPGSPVYNIPRAVRLTGQLNRPALQRAFDELVARHETLRTTFQTAVPQPIQIVSPTGKIELKQMEYSHLPTTAEIQHIITTEARTPFNLTTGPLLRATLLKLTETDHILLLTLHHIITDGWSMTVLTRELASFYEQFSDQYSVPNIQHPITPLPLPLQYGEFAQQQQTWLQGEVLQKLLNYWQEKLKDSPVLPLPTDYPRPAMQTFEGSTVNVTLPVSLAQAVKSFSQREGVTLFMSLLAAFKVLLYRYTNQPDVVIGTPAANRNQREVEGIIGIFVNTLVLRTTLAVRSNDFSQSSVRSNDFSRLTAEAVTTNPNFRDVLRQVRETVFGALAHQEMPFEKLVEELQPERSLSHHPLFQVMFILQNAGESEIKLPGLLITPMAVENGTAKFDLTLSLRETADSLTASFEYNTHLFTEATIRRMAGHYQVLLQAIITNPNTPILRLPLLTTAEMQQILVEWNKTTAVFPPVCIHHLFEQQVEQTPDKKAAVFGSHSLTYQELNQQANHLAHSLQQRGIGPGQRVGIQMERSLGMLVVLLGILKTGAAYTPLDLSFPSDRLVFMKEDASLDLVMDMAHYSVINDQYSVTSEPRSAENLQVPTSPEDIAYVIYTSGSTGKPKGVEVLHRGVVNFLTSMQKEPGITADDILLAVTTLSFDIAGLELFLPLCVGSQVVIASQEQQTDGAKLLQAILESGATMMQATPATWQLLLEAGWGEHPHLHKILCGGEALSRSLADQLLLHCDELWNLYGPTETTIWSTCGRVGKPASKEAVQHSTFSTPHSPIPIGRPIANTQIYILNSQLQPVPVGVVGDLYIGGAGLAKGYLNQPELTRERFIHVELGMLNVELRNSPFSVQHSSFLLYKTGDLARYWADGQIEFLGRSDFQVKVRGFRIELEEIEAALAKHTAVREAVVMAREDTPGDKRLVAYLLETAVPHPAPTELRQFLQQTLPDYMIPPTFIWLDNYPLTPNGKVNRLALPALDVQTAEQQMVYIPPRDIIELQLCQLWEELLPAQPIGVTDNFFHLGGHSLLAMRLMTQIEKQFGRSLPLAALFQNQTVEQLATVLRNNEATLHSPFLASHSLLIPLTPRPSSAPPLFLVHPVGGNILCYVELARILGKERPIFGIQAIGLQGKDPPTTVEAMARAYVTAVRQQQSDGPYYLGGWSLGGLIAFEMARQLTAQGETVAFLGLIDAWPVVNSQSPTAVELLIRFLQELAGRQLVDEVMISAHLHTLNPDEQLVYVAVQARTWGLLPPDADIERLRPLWAVFRANMQALRSYQPGKYNGRICLYPSIATYDWQTLTPHPVTLHTLSGNHFTLLTKPHVYALATALQNSWRDDEK